MASLTSTSGGKIPVDSTETAQRRVSTAPRQPQPAAAPCSCPSPSLTPHCNKPDLHSHRSSYLCQQEAPTDSIPKQVTHGILNAWMLRVGRGTEQATHAGQALLVHTNHSSGTLENGALTDVMVPYSGQAHKVFQTLMSENFSAECVQPCIGYSCHLFS